VGRTNAGEAISILSGAATGIHPKYRESVSWWWRVHGRFVFNQKVGRCNLTGTVVLSRWEETVTEVCKQGVRSLTLCI